MAMVTFSLVNKLLEPLIALGKEELARQLGLPDDVMKLQGTLERLQCYLQDAEKKSIEHDSTKLWLNQINDVVYDIEDLLEDYYGINVDNSESSSSGSGESSSSFTRVGCHFPIPSCLKNITPSKYRIGAQIQSLNKKLTDEIMDQIPKLELMRSFASSGPVANQITQNQLTAHMTPSGLIRSDIVGNIIHDDARRLIESLTKEDDRDNLLVYAIVGMGGIGKTTLAKLVFHDHVIRGRFDLKSWIVVSQNYDVIDIMRRIITPAGGDEEHSQNLNLLSEKVKNVVEGKRLFMVLDDVWETERVWKGVLSTLLRSGAAKGSRVLITTRNKEVADQMMAVHSHQVQPLSQEDGWSLLCKSAFPAWEQQEAKDDAWNLKDIGVELVKKCDGLPLAINVIGGMLSAENRTREAWEFVLKSSVWEVNGLPKEIHSALYISYQHLPPNVKQCFLYCSLFPEDADFYIEVAVELWIQEGLIKDEMGISSRDIGKRYFWMLVRRNLLKINSEYFVAVSFTMHDIVYSLSRFLKKNESLVTTDEKDILNCSGRTMKLRHLSFMGRDNKTVKILPKCLQEQVSLRTLLIFDKFISEIDDGLFNHLRHLRTLSLHGTEIKKLPKSLGALKQLRYLDLSETHIKKLPKTIQKLRNLRTLDVSGCTGLCNLPLCIMKLHNLGCFRVQRSALDRLPPGLGRLKKLQNLHLVMPLEDIAQESSTLKELGMLTELRRLALFKLERVLDKSQAKSAALKDKQQLQSLYLGCSESDSNADLINSAQDNEANKIVEEIFEELCPPPQLEVLYIYDFSGSVLPSWLGDAKLKSLMHLYTSGFRNCKQLVGIGLLASLESLQITGLSSIKSIGPEFYTGNSRSNIEMGALEPAYQNVVFFPRIKILFLHNMDSLEEWSGLGKAIPAMPHLEILQISTCPKLKSFPEELLEHAAASLKEIRICDSGELLLKAVQNLPCLIIMQIENITPLERISGLPTLQELLIEDCPGIKLVELKHSLRRISWTDYNTDTLPGWFSNDGHGDDNKLKAASLKISCKEELVRKICSKENEDHEWSKIQHIDDITVWDEDGYLRLAYTKNTNSFTKYPGKTEGETSSV